MSRRLFRLAAASLCLALSACAAHWSAKPAGSAQPVATIYRGAQVWNGDGFDSRDLVIYRERVVRAAPRGAPVQVEDASGRFIVPAYANAHTHVTNPTPQGSRDHLSTGVFYIWNPNTVVLDEAAKAFFARPDTVDVAIAQGGITEPGGHPERLYVEVLTQFLYQGRPREWFIGNAFHFARDPAQIVAALDLLVRQRADFVKAYLLHSEEYEKRRDDPAFYGQKGLNPANLPLLVREARRRGLPVAAHVETAADMRVAASADVAMAGHLPGYGGATGASYALSPEDARLVARSGMAVVPTFSVGAARVADAEDGTPNPRRDAVHALQRGNLRLLKEAGAVILMGTDGRGPVFDEAEHWVALGVFTPREVTRLVFATARHLYPKRRIGCLEAGCEADFLLLTADPTQDIANLRSLDQAVKAGRIVWEAEAKGNGRD